MRQLQVVGRLAERVERVVLLRGARHGLADHEEPLVVDGDDVAAAQLAAAARLGLAVDEDPAGGEARLRLAAVLRGRRRA